MMAPSPLGLDGQAVSESELNDLRQKFQLLEGDRKAYYEMSMQTMKENKKTIAGLRDGNKGLRKNLAGVQRQARSSAHASQDMASGKEMAKMEKHVMVLRKNFDTLKSAVDGRRGELRALRDEASALALDSRRPSQEDSPLTRKIRMLENRLDKAMIKYNEAQSIRKTYEQIVKRLKEERTGFDNQLGAIERTLQAKQHDYAELQLLSGDASHAKDVSMQDLDKARAVMAEARKEREREVKGKKELVSVRQDVVSRLEKREQMRHDIIAKANGDLSEQEEINLKTSLALNQLTQGKVVNDTREHRAKIDIYEEAFRKIKDATGVSDVNEVIQKLISQEDTTRNLKDLTKENQEKVESLQADREKLAKRVEEVKYSGSGGSHRRKMVDDLEETLAHAVAKQERARLRFERLAKVLINVKAGVSHLSEKLESVQADNKHLIMNDDTVVDVLLACEAALCGILAKVNADNDAEAKEEMRLAIFNAFDDAEVVSSRPYNQRVALPDAGDDNARGPDGAAAAAKGGSAEPGNAERSVQEHDDLDGLDMLNHNDDGEEELTRDRIKKASQTIVATHEKKVKRKQGKGASSGKQDGSHLDGGDVAAQRKNKK